MEDIVLIKYGELTTKKDNRKVFINLLSNYLYEKLKNYDVKIVKDRARMYVYFDDKYVDDVICVLKNCFGIHAFNLAYKVNTNSVDIKEKVLELLNNISFNSFKVVTNRRDKSFEICSMDFNNVVGGYILRNIPNIKVDVKCPDIYVNIEINKDETYIYFNDIKASGGYPYGSLGNGLLMLSGGIDSPVAGYLALKRGIKISAIYFEAIPHTSLFAREKVISLAKELLKYSLDFNLYVVPITKLQEEIYNKCDSTYIITILRRMMYRISEEIARKNNCMVLINGESVGQVASQTLASMNVINEVVKIPVLRPVACFDKLEIIDIAKKINTYDTSILPYEDCCTIFVPRHPVINPKIGKCIENESRFDYRKFVDDAVNDTFTLRISNLDDFSNLL